MFLALTAAPSQQATGILTSLGMTTTVATGLESQLAALGVRPSAMAAELAQPNGIAGAMTMFNAAISGLSPTDREALVAKIFGGGRSESTALAILQNPGLLTQFTNRVGTLSQPATFMSDWQKTQKTFSFQWGAFTSDISNLGVTIGKDVVPVLGAFLDVLGPLAKFIADNKVAAAGLSAVLGYALAAEIVKVTALLGERLAWGLSMLVFRLAGVDSAAGRSIASLWGLTGAEDAQAVAANRDAAATARAAVANTAQGGTSGGLAGEEMLGGGLLARLGMGGGGGGAGVGLGGIGLPLALGGLAGAGVNELLLKTGVLGALRGLVRGPNAGPVKLPWYLTSGGLAKQFGMASGGIFSHPTAIVGEGSHHPEYVIPTAPAYRARALSLYSSLGAHLMAEGGTLGSISLSFGNASEAALQGLGRPLHVHVDIDGREVGRAVQRFTADEVARR